MSGQGIIGYVQDIHHSLTQPANLVMHHGFPFPLPRLRINKRPARHEFLSGKSCLLLLAKRPARLLGKPRTLQGCLPLRTRQGVIQPPLSPYPSPVCSP